jgi:hypothetical protein
MSILNAKTFLVVPQASEIKVKGLMPRHWRLNQGENVDMPPISSARDDLKSDLLRDGS